VKPNNIDFHYGERKRTMKVQQLFGYKNYLPLCSTGERYSYRF